MKPAAAGLASFLFPGLGQFAQGRIRAAGVSIANAALGTYLAIHWYADRELLDLVCLAICVAVHVFQALEAVEHGKRSSSRTS